MEVARRLLASLFPSRCILCQKTVDQPDNMGSIEICCDCYKSLPFNNHHCVQCALPLPESIGSNTLCGRCIKKQPSYDYVNSIFRYETDVTQLIHALKFSEKITYAKTIGEMLCSVMDIEDKPDCLLPVPLHSSRMRQRGFNQSIEISRVIEKRLDLPINFNGVIRKRSTTAQSNLSAKQRQSNIKDSFQVAGNLNFKHVLIVDDVMTTGATVNELAQVLKESGVERVGVLCVARAPKNH